MLGSLIEATLMNLTSQFDPKPKPKPPADMLFPFSTLDAVGMCITETKDVPKKQG